MSSDLIDSYVHKTVERRRSGVSLKFLTSQSLFSSNAIDPGTNLLLRTMTAHSERQFGRGVDLGCGYGVIGISLVASGQVREMHVVDRDALALALAKRNAQINSLERVEACSSLGLDDAPSDRYDLVISNLPGKAGEAVLRHFLESACDHLEEGGQFWGVVVSPLWPFMERVLASLQADLIHVEHGSRHSVFGFQKSVPETVHSVKDSLTDVYRRDEIDFLVSGRNYRIGTSRGISEFDSIGYSTQLLLEQFYELRGRRFATGVTFNVGQGYVPVALKASGMVKSLSLIDRDLLSLRTAEQNLASNGLNEHPTDLHHEVAWVPDGETRYDLIAGAFLGDEPREALEISFGTVIDRLDQGGVAVIAGGSTPVTRLLKSLALRKDARLVDRQKYRGLSAIVISKTG